MATNFPSNIDSYTTVVDNVDNVIASHVNDKGLAITAIETKLGVDNSAVATTIDYFLKNASGTFRTHIHNGTDAARVSLTALSDLNLGSLANAQYLRYNATSAKWENYTFTYALSLLSDVVLGSPANLDGLTYNTSTSKWISGKPHAVYA